MERVTIKDVAKEAGVSIGTVSNALNGGRYISPDTKKRVLDAVEKLKYIPNLNGRYLKSGASQTIGFFTNTVAGAYCCTLLEAISRQCDRRGYHLNIFVAKDPAVIVGNIMGQCFDGVIIYENQYLTGKEIAMLRETGLKIVFLDRECSGPGMSGVLFDSYRAGYEAARYMLRLGHRRIAFIECDDEVRDSRRRKEGYLAALSESGGESMILTGEFEEEYSFNSVTNLIRLHAEKLPEAFLAGNDLSAIGCIRALRAEGYRVPEDVSVAGFDDIDIAQYYRPPLTTVRNPIARQGMLAVDTLIALLEEQEEGSIKMLTGELIVRESCAVRC